MSRADMNGGRKIKDSGDISKHKKVLMILKKKYGWQIRIVGAWERGWGFGGQRRLNFDCALV